MLRRVKAGRKLRQVKTKSDAGGCVLTGTLASGIWNAANWRSRDNDKKQATFRVIVSSATINFGRLHHRKQQEGAP